MRFWRRVTTALMCQTVTATTTDELRARRDAARAVDLVELRLDGVREPDVHGAIAGRRLPVIVTCRPTWEGGRFDGSEQERRCLLERALEAGAEYVDIEWRAGFEGLINARGGRGIVLSMHDFHGVPEDLSSIYLAMRQTGAEVVKIAVTARRLCDVFVFESVGLSDFRRSTSSRRPEPVEGRTSGLSDCVFIAMGPAGLATRVLPARFGSRWTYVGSEAPGQIGAARLLTEFRFRDISPSPAVYGVVGKCVSRSLSPALHNAAFATAGADAVYLPFETDDYDDFLAFAEHLPVTGASVTMPFKELAMRHASEVDQAAERVGAVNTLRREGSRWQATNTDVEGFLDPIRDVPLRGCRVAILGAGGAARAVAVAAGNEGALVSVFARSRERAQAVAALVGGDGFVGLPDKGTWNVLVNATPVGSAPDADESPIPADRLTGQLVCDLVYDPRETRLLREARAAGCRTIGGFEMLVAQARRQREWWLRGVGSGL